MLGSFRILMVVGSNAATADKQFSISLPINKALISLFLGRFNPCKISKIDQVSGLSNANLTR